MATLPEPMHTTVAKIYQAYESDAEEGNRPHLGASLIGHACERYLWMTFRWVDAKKFPGRMLRLFETGQLAEARFTANLRRIGVEVHDTTPDGKQWRVSDLGGHFAGSMDGAGRGFPEAPKTWAVLEYKTHGEKSFNELVKNKVQKAKPQHYAQMQVYMGYTGMDRAMYMAVNKNTDDLYTEWVHFDPVEFAKMKARAERVVTANEPPLRISNDPSWFVCKMCDFHEHCHGEKAPAVNCRTCAHSTAELDGDSKWTCNVPVQPIGEGAGENIDIQRQRHGCPSHRYIPILLEKFATQTDYVNGDVVYTDGTGATFANGEGPGALTSQEIRTAESKSMLGALADMKSQLAAQGIDSKVVA
jgi:hypothetical protein